MQFDDLQAGRHFDDDAIQVNVACECVPNDGSLEMD